MKKDKAHPTNQPAPMTSLLDLPSQPQTVGAEVVYHGYKAPIYHYKQMLTWERCPRQN